MNTLALLVKSGISYAKSNGFWVRLDCTKCSGQQTQTVGLNYVTNVFVCHRCGWKGKSRDLFKSLGVKDNASQLEYVEDKPKSLVQDFPENCVEAWTNTKSRAYLQSRNITQKQAEHFGFYFCADRRDRYCDRLILPVFDHRQRYRTFQGRTVVGDEPKYLNASGGQLSSLLYGLSWNFYKRNQLLLVEGIFDCLHTYPYSVASFSKNISDTQINLLRLSGCEEIVIIFDHDSWSETPEKHQHNVEKLSKYFFVKDIRLEHDTPTEFSMDEIQTMVRETSFV